MMPPRELILWFVFSCLSAQAIGGFVIYFLVMRKVRTLQTNPLEASAVMTALVNKISATHDGVTKASDALVQVGMRLEQIYQICPLGKGNESKSQDC